MAKQKQLCLGVIPAALLAIFGTIGDVRAQDDEITELTEPKSSISVGAGYWSGDDRAQSGKYDGMNESGKAYGLLDASIVKRYNDTGTWYRLDARNLGIDDTRSIRGEVLRQGNWGIGLEYNRISRRDPNVYHTNLQGAGTWNPTNNIGTPGRLGPQLTTLRLGTTREQINANIYKNLWPGLDFTATFKNEEKTGARNWGHASGIFTVEPINSTTRQLETALTYATEKFQIRGGYNASWYQNNVTNGLVANTYRSSATAITTAYASLPLDNEAHQVFLNGGYNFTNNTRGTFKAEYARATQDNGIPVVGFGQANGGYNRLDTRVDTTLLQLGLNSRITKQFTLNGNLRYHDRDDKTTVVNYISNGTPYVGSSVRTLSGKVEGTYRFGSGYSLVGSVEEKRQRRDQPIMVTGTDKTRAVAFRRDLDETTSRLELRRSMSETINGSVSWVHAERDGSAFMDSYKNVMAGMINPMSIADRKRDKLRLLADWAPIDAVSVQFVVEDGRDRYSGDNTYGLERGKTRLYSLDGSWAISNKLSLNAWYSYDQSEARQTGGNTTVQNYQYDLKDGANSFGLGIRWDATPRLRTGADMEWTQSVSKYDILALTPVTGGTTDLSDITNRHLRLSWFAQYALNKSSDLRLDAIYDYWKTDDWTWQYSDGTPFRMADGTYITTDPVQKAVFVGVRYIYRFQ
uniref:MtrB/PioB family decaheme-associated outer membrane protein n=1 Tax=Castellaniella defragrans TaxID=75697 RepID=UPI00333F609E